MDPMGGGQFQQAIQQIVEAERQPIRTLEVRKAREEAKMKLFQEFKGKFSGFDKTLAEFSNFRNFRDLKVNLGDGEQFISVTVDKDRAEPGTYSLEVEQLAERSSIISNGFEDPAKNVLGVGFINIELANGEDMEIYVDESNASLNGVAKLLNTQANSPVQASVIKDGSDPDRPWRLIVTGKDAGSDDEIHFPEFYFLDGEEELEVRSEKKAQNALIKIDGFPIEVEGNTIENFLQGVNLQLKEARPGRPFTVSIAEDNQKVSGKVKGLVDQLNSVLDFINKQNQVNETTDTRTSFAGDTSLQSIEYRLRNLLHEGFPVGHPDDENFRFVHLNQIGVEFDKAGTIQFKEEKFTQALEKDFAAVAEAITGEWGFAVQMREVVNGYTRPGSGMLSVREAALRNRIRQVDDQIVQKERRLEQKTKALTAQFSRLQTSLAKMQSQQAYLASSMGGGGGDMISQLMG